MTQTLVRRCEVTASVVKREGPSSQGQVDQHLVGQVAVTGPAAVPEGQVGLHRLVRHLLRGFAPGPQGAETRPRPPDKDQAAPVLAGGGDNFHRHRLTQAGRNPGRLPPGHVLRQVGRRGPGPER